MTQPNASNLEDVKKFTFAAADDPGLSARLANAISGKTGEEAAQAFAALAKAEGYHFSAADAMQAFRMFASKLPLSENELEKVVGGTGSPYAGWLSASATNASNAAANATAAASAYEAAFAATVPPPVVAANRALLAGLVATNFLGINTPSIAATEAAYAEMWAQDASAMYSYKP